MKYTRIKPERKLSVDQAVSEFMAELRQLPPGDARAAAGEPARSPAEADEARFLLAAKLLLQMCPDPTSCTDPTCRRNRQCRHLADLLSLQQSPPPGSRRPPGAVALRRAIHLYQSRRVLE